MSEEAQDIKYLYRLVRKWQREARTYQDKVKADSLTINSEPEGQRANIAAGIRQYSAYAVAYYHAAIQLSDKLERLKERRKARNKKK